MLLSVVVRVGPSADVEERLRLAVDWEVPQDCPDVDALRTELEAALGQGIRFDPSAEASVQGRIRKLDQGGYRISLTTSVAGQREQRVLDESSCPTLVDTATFVIALALEPYASAARTPSQAQPTTVPPETTPTVPPLREPTREPAPPPRARPPDPGAALIFVEGQAAFAITAAVAGGLGGGLGWQRQRVRVDAAFRHRLQVGTGRDPGVGLSLTSAAARGCFVPRWGRFELGACGGIEAGAMRATGRGRDVAATTRRTPWFGLLAGVDASVAIVPQLWLRVRAELVGVPRRPAFHVRVDDVARGVYLASPLAANIAVGMELRLFGTK